MQRRAGQNHFSVHTSTEQIWHNNFCQAKDEKEPILFPGVPGVTSGFTCAAKCRTSKNEKGGLIKDWLVYEIAVAGKAANQQKQTRTDIIENRTSPNKDHQAVGVLICRVTTRKWPSSTPLFLAWFFFCFLLLRAWDSGVSTNSIPIFRIKLCQWN